MNLRNYIGLACTGHDNALAIVDSKGDLIFAEGTERYLQNKRAISYPPDDTIRIGKLIEKYCEPGADLVIAKSWSDDFVENFSKEKEKANDAADKANGSPLEWIERFEFHSSVFSFFEPLIKQAGANLISFCEGSKRKYELRAYDHHLTHAAAGCFTSPYKEAVCIVIDGAGEKTAHSFFSYREGKLENLRKNDHEPLESLGSLGFFYGHLLCRLCGFGAWEGEEWKVMGLAPYGKRDEKIHDAMKRYMQVSGLKLFFPETAMDAYLEILTFARKPNSPSISVADLAHTGQLYFSELVTELLGNLYDRKVSQNLVLGGGCALNSAYSGKILEQTKFKRFHIYSAPADDGNAVGAALLAYYEDHSERLPKPGFYSPYKGSEISEETLGNLKKFGGINGLSILADEEIYKKTAKLLTEGKIIGWVQGKAEFGPRALGNRSILADPRNPGMKDKINESVKFREEFRPFAPSILHEFGDEYFMNYQETPYMERTLIFKEEVRDKVPAVVHEDYTGRLQTVKKEWNEPYYLLIHEFYKLTGVPILLNTSLNVMGKPMVHSVEDAVALFYTCGLEALVLGNYLIEKKGTV